MLKVDRKVFGIGLRRTGTKSLASALNLLNIKTIHYPNDVATETQIRKGDYNLDILNKYQGVTDITVAPFYPDLDMIYPGSKFILTVRDERSWIKSIERHYNFILHNKDSYDKRFNDFTKYIGKKVYNSALFKKEKFINAYRSHNLNVVSYFKERSADFLLMDIVKGDGWERLCPFLGLEIPQFSFPHNNKGRWQNNLIRFRENREVILEEILLLQSNDKIIVVDDGLYEDELNKLPQFIPFLENKGIFWGYPTDDSHAINELKRLKKEGAEYIVFVAASFWWFDHYDNFSSYLDCNESLLYKNANVVVYKLI